MDEDEAEAMASQLNTAAKKRATKTAFHGANRKSRGLRYSAAMEDELDADVSVDLDTMCPVAALPQSDLTCGGANLRDGCKRLLCVTAAFMLVLGIFFFSTANPARAAVQPTSSSYQAIAASPSASPSPIPPPLPPPPPPQPPPPPPTPTPSPTPTPTPTPSPLLLAWPPLLSPPPQTPPPNLFAFLWLAPPAPPAPSAPVHVPSLVERLNARFHRDPFECAWRRDGLLADCGILYHGSDGWEDHELEFMPRERRSMSASMLYHAQYPIRTFGGSTRGLILRPGAVRILCGCGQDCGANCEPGIRKACEPARDCRDERDTYCSNCAWQPGPAFGELFLRGKRQSEFGQGQDHYNEIVVDGGYWLDHMPDAVEAIVANEQVRDAFLRRYPEFKPHRSRDFPLVRLDLRNREAPFS